MAKDLIIEMFEKTYPTHFRHASWKTDNLNFEKVLDYLLKVIKLINTEKELIIFKCEWLRIETKIDDVFCSHSDNIICTKIAEINNHILFLEDEENLEKFVNQNGFENFYKGEYQVLFEKSLELKKLDEQSRISSKRKHHQAATGFRFYFSIV